VGVLLLPQHPEVTGVFNIVVQKEKQSGASGKKK
jgi:hypothetical protein